MTRPAPAAGEPIRDAIPVQYRVALMDLHPNRYQARGRPVCPACGQAMPCLTAMLLEKINDLEDAFVRLSQIVDACPDCSEARAAEDDL